MRAFYTQLLSEEYGEDELRLNSYYVQQKS